MILPRESFSGGEVINKVRTCKASLIASRYQEREVQVSSFGGIRAVNASPMFSCRSCERSHKASPCHRAPKPGMEKGMEKGDGKGDITGFFPPCAAADEDHEHLVDVIQAVDTRRAQGGSGLQQHVPRAVPSLTHGFVGAKNYGRCRTTLTSSAALTGGSTTGAPTT